MEDLFNANKSLLKSMLLDERKLITYVSISKDLCVHVNMSKIMLHRLVEHVRQETPELQLNVSYIICGATENNNARTIVCSEQESNKEKECFKNIFFEHIYSVAKGCPNIDTSAYVAVNKFEDFLLCGGVIKSKQCDKRTTIEIGDLKSNSQDITIPEKNKTLPLSSKKIKQETNTAKNGISETKSLSKNMESKSEPIIKKETISPKSETLVPVINNKLKPNSSNGQKTQKRIAGFFNKINNDLNKKEVKENIEDVKDKKEKTDSNAAKCNKMDVENTISIVSKVKVEDKKDTSNKILNDIKRTSKVDKKRKRVLHVSDSESDNENSDPFEEQLQVTNDSEDEIPPTPTISNIVIKSGIVNPKKRRKVVDKTYTDDEYIVTKKVEVYESCSDNDEATNEVKPLQAKEVKSEVSPKGKTSGSKKKFSPPQKGKQQTLTNFFKKI